VAVAVGIGQASAANTAPEDSLAATIVGPPIRFDDSAARTELGIEPRRFAETVADAVRWLVESRRVPPRRSPRLGLA
jgi:hypothetical protein